MREHQSNSPVSSRNRQASTKTLKHISRIHPIQQIPFFYRQAYPCHMRARSIWLCSTAMDSKTEPLLLALITGQACSPHKRLVLFFLLLSNQHRLKMRLRSMTPPRATRPISGLIQNAATTSMPIMPTATFLSNGRVMVVLLTFLTIGRLLFCQSRCSSFLRGVSPAHERVCPGGGTTPSWFTRPSMSTTPQSSANLPSTRRLMRMPVTITCLPVGGMFQSGPFWVPRHV
jgi:hypothetical protein